VIKVSDLILRWLPFPDPNKRRQYDVHGDDGSVAELGSVRVDELGTMGRLFGALVTKAGIPVPTEITQKVLTTARHLQSGSTSVPGFELPQVQSLGWGQVRRKYLIDCEFVLKLLVSVSLCTTTLLGHRGNRGETDRSLLQNIDQRG